MKLKSMVLGTAVALGCSLTGAAWADTLTEIYQLALENDAQLKAAKANVASGREFKNLFRAGLLPQINASYTISDSDFDDTSGGVTLPTTDERDTLSVSLSQNLFDLSVWYDYQRGNKLTEQAEATFAFDQQDLIVRVAEAYFNVLGAQANLSSAIAEETAIQRQLEQTQQRFDVGLIPITDVHEARAAYDSAVVARLAEEGNLGIAFEALTVITGESHDDLWELKEGFKAENPSPAARTEWVQFALDNNFQLKASKLGVDAALENSRSARSGHMPTVTGSFSYTDSESDGQNFGSDFELDRDGTSFQISLNVPIFSGGATSANRRQAHQDYLRTLELHNFTQRNTIQNTRSLHLAVTTDAARVKARKLAITSAQSALDATQAGYEVGTRNVVDVLDAQRVLYRSQRDYANTRYSYVLNLLRLKQQAGTLSPQDLLDLNAAMQAPAAAN